MPWIVWASGSLFGAFQFMLQTSSSVMVPQLIQSFATNPEGVGFLASSFFYPYLIMQIPGGLLIDRYGPRLILTIGCVLFAAACWWFGHAPTMLQATLSRMLMGFASAPAIAGAFYLAAHWFAPNRFALVVGLTEFLAGMGGVLGEAVIGHWVERFGWRLTITDCGLLVLLLALLIWLVVRDKPNHQLDKSAPKQPQTPAWERIKMIIRLPQVWLNGIFAALTFAMVSSFGGLWAVSFIRAKYGVSPETAAISSSLVFLGVAFGAPMLGWISDKIGRRRRVMWIGALFCLFIMLAILYLPLSHAMMNVALFAVGFTSAVYALPFAVVREITPTQARGTGMGFTNMMCIIIGSPILQPFIGYMLDLNGSGKARGGVATLSVHDYVTALSVLPLCLLGALIVSYFIKETYCKEKNS